MKGYIAAVVAGYAAWVLLFLAIAIAVGNGGSNANWIAFAGFSLLPAVVGAIFYAVVDYDKLTEEASDGRRLTYEVSSLQSQLRAANDQRDNWQKIALAPATEQKELLAAKTRTLVRRSNDFPQPQRGF